MDYLVDLVYLVDYVKLMETVNIHDAKTSFSKLIRRVRKGHEIIIAIRGRPVARLCPLESPKARQPGLLSGKIDEAFFDPLPDEELKAWEK